MPCACKFLSLETLCTVLDRASDGIFIYNNELRTVYCNYAALSFFGMDTSEIALCRTWDELKSAGFFFGDAAPTALRQKKRCASEFVNRIGRHLLCIATPVLDEQREVIFVVSNVRDITDFIKTRQELSEHKQQLRKIKKTLNLQQHKQNNDFVYCSPQMNKIMETIERAARTDVSVFLLGESGVGKSELAKHIHKLSARSKGRLVVTNCGAIPPTLCEAEFFGYEKGAFTGADKATPGLFESAEGGTLVLDEIGELDPVMQVKLLRVLQENRVKRLGSQQEIPINVRIIAATNQNIKQMIYTKQFRDDLYHRLNVVQISIPPLRERPTDIRFLLYYFLSHYNAKYDMSKTMSPKLVAALERYSWPGNSREMAHLIERLVVLSTSDEMGCEYLPEEIQEDTCDKYGVRLTSLENATQEAERELLQAARERLGDTRSMARVLKVSHVTVARKLKQYGIS